MEIISYVVSGALAWNETTPGVGATPAMNAGDVLKLDKTRAVRLG